MSRPRLALEFDDILFPIRSARIEIFRRAISSTLLVVLVAGMVGVPLVAPSLRPASDERFPCENCPCGCATADYCWDKCCCFSDTEKLQWAADNGITPPEFLVARAGQADQLKVAASQIAASQPACCCCKSADRVPRDSACTIGAAPELSSVKESVEADSASNAPVRIVLLQDAAKCRGIDLVWSILSCMNVHAQPPTIGVLAPWFLYTLPVGNDCATSVCHALDPPVP